MKSTRPDSPSTSYSVVSLKALVGLKYDKNVNKKGENIKSAISDKIEAENCLKKDSIIQKGTEKMIKISLI